MYEKQIKQATKIINSEKKMIQLTEEEKKSYSKQTFCNICQTEFSYNDKNCYEVKDHCHYTRKYRSAAHNIFNLR